MSFGPSAGPSRGIWRCSLCPLGASLPTSPSPSSSRMWLSPHWEAEGLPLVVKALDKASRAIEHGLRTLLGCGVRAEREFPSRLLGSMGFRSTHAHPYEDTLPNSRGRHQRASSSLRQREEEAPSSSLQFTQRGKDLQLPLPPPESSCMVRGSFLCLITFGPH